LPIKVNKLIDLPEDFGELVNMSVRFRYYFIFIEIGLNLVFVVIKQFFSKVIGFGYPYPKKDRISGNFRSDPVIRRFPTIRQP